MVHQRALPRALRPHDRNHLVVCAAGSNAAAVNELLHTIMIESSISVNHLARFCHDRLKGSWALLLLKVACDVQRHRTPCSKAPKIDFPQSPRMKAFQMIDNMYNSVL
jgi:hypothetical protein